MKNFTKEFTNKALFKPTRWLFVALMFLLGTSGAWGANNVSGGYIYFDNSVTGWSDNSIQFVIGHASFSRTYQMSKLANSNVYYYKLDDAEYHTWGDATYYAVIGTSSKWGDGSWGSSNLTNATHRTAAYTSTYNLNSGSTYCFTPSSSSNGASLTITTSYPNTTNRAYVYAVSNGSTAATSKAAAGTVKVTGYYISAQGTTSSRTATSTASNYAASNTFVRGTTITMSVNSTGSGYTFKGWYSSSTASSTNLLGTNTTYSYTSSGSSTKTVYAVFEENSVVTYTVKKSETGGTGTVTLGGTTITTGGVSISSGSKALSITAPTGYNVSTVTVSGGSLTTAGTAGSSTYSGTVNVTAATTITITYVAKTFTVKKSETGGTGTVTLGGTAITTGGVSISYGSKALSITAPTGYNVSSVTVSGGSLTTAGTTGSSSYSGTVNVTAATTITITYAEICYQSATEGEGSFSNGTITLSAIFNTCGSAYIGFQWKEEGKDWCYDNSNDCYVQLGSQIKQNEIATTTVTKPSGTSYVFRPYIVVGNDAKNWLYGTEFTVGTCTLPIINSTDASFNKNNFADFAALYVTDCSGKEVTAYQWYKDGNEYVSKCNYTTKDGVVNGDAGKTNNIRPNAAGNYTCKATYKDGSSATSAAFVVSATSGTTYADFKSNLPVIMVNTGQKDFPSCPAANETASKNAEKMKKKLSVDVKILFDGSIVYDRKARMAYRGSSSLNFQKKSYAFCPGDANCGDADKGPDYVKTAKLNMLGIGEAADKDWVLYAAAADPSMLRNRMVFETYQAMRPGEWGVKSRYVELIINGEYKGVYLMMDKITQNKKRVNVEWDVKDETKRGFILKFDKTDIPDRSVDYPDGDEKTFLSKYSGKYDITTYDAQVDQAFEIEYPEKGDIEDDGGNWYEVIDFIKGMINEFETALSAGDYAKVQQYIDYESWADWFILSEYTKNVDAFRASCVFTYDGTKIKATPLWDQELSFNNQSVHANRYTSDAGNKGCQSAIGLLIKNDKVYTDGFAAPFWFTGKLAGGKGTEKLAEKTFAGALLNDPCFVQTVKNRWAAHKTGALSNASLTALITNYEKELTSDVRTREANFWSSNGYSRNTLSCSWNSNSTGYYDDTYADAKADITAWISDNNASTSGTGRRKGLDAAISELEGTGLDISISPASIETTPWVPVVIQVQNETGYEYTLTYTDGSLDQVKDLIIEKSGDTYKYHIPRPWPAGDEQVEGERANINYGIKATLQVGDGNVQCGSSSELPSATASIILKDEDNDDCKQN